MIDRFFQALDILHLWADTRKLPISVSRNEISVTCTADLSHDAEKVCTFMVFILKNNWTYHTVNGDHEYKFIFYETDEPVSKKHSASPPDISKPKKRKTSTTVPQTKTLFD